MEKYLKIIIITSPAKRKLYGDSRGHQRSGMRMRKISPVYVGWNKIKTTTTIMITRMVPVLLSSPVLSTGRHNH